jgi:hypothetical protein
LFGITIAEFNLTALERAEVAVEKNSSSVDIS